MLWLILASMFVTATRAVAKESNLTTSIFGTPPSPIGVRAIGNSYQPNDSLCSKLNKKGGSCISIFKCAKLFELYQKPSTLDPNDQKLLLDSFCGWDLGAPYVCCQPISKYYAFAQVTAIKPKPPPSTERSSSSEISCGRSILTENRSKVTGGEPSALGAWPWMAALYARSGFDGDARFICGGTLISKEWVLTAAHCIPETAKTKLSHVRLGDLDLDSAADQASPVDVEIKEVIKHAQYSKKPVVNDIALLRLSKPVEYTDFIRPICLHTNTRYMNATYYDRKRPFIAGWGAVEYLGEQSNLLREAEIDVAPHPKCSKSYDRFVKANEVRIDKNVICANAPMKDTCQGDSGGPLMFREDKTWFQGGIVSVGYECAKAEFPGIYTKVASFTDWIQKKTGLNL